MALDDQRDTRDVKSWTDTAAPPAGGTTNVLFAGTVVIVALWAIGQIARDATWLSGLCFYIPSIFLAAVLVGWALVFLSRCRRTNAAVAAGLALLPLGVVLFVENHFAAAPLSTAPGEMRLVHWNVENGLAAGAQDVLRNLHADIFVLSEIPDAEGVEEFRSTLGREYQAQVFGNLAVVAAGAVRAEGWLIDRPRTKVQRVTWVRNGRPLSLLVVDLPSEIYVHRDPLLREIHKLIERHQPDLVVGDFNAPRRSRALGALPAGYRHAYDSAGSGYGCTWPVPVPMYSLDHCLHSARIVPARYTLQTSIYSDHRLQVFDFGVIRRVEGAGGETSAGPSGLVVGH